MTELGIEPDFNIISKNTEKLQTCCHTDMQSGRASADDVCLKPADLTAFPPGQIAYI